MPEDTPKHGGDIYGLARAMGLPLHELLDFSANINPLGYPPGVAAALAEALKDVVHYPDRRCLELREALAAYHNLNAPQVLAGNGSTELIYLAARALKPKRALVVAPAFSEYEQALGAAAIPVDYHVTTEEHGFSLAEDLDPASAEMVFLANPASPSGTLLSRERLHRLMASLESRGVYLVLDEAFVDFAEEVSMKRHLMRFPRLIILRSFTKFFGIPGIRLGYLLAAPELVSRLSAAQEPWSVSTLAQAAGRACLADVDFMRRTRDLVRRESKFLLNQLAAIPGLSPLPSSANYLLVKLLRPGWNAAQLQRAMLRLRVIIRDASNFRGLDERYFRLAVRRRDENYWLLNALEHCLKKAQ